jgi:hypothetical protein
MQGRYMGRGARDTAWPRATLGRVSPRSRAVRALLVVIFTTGALYKARDAGRAPRAAATHQPPRATADSRHIGVLSVSHTRTVS